jgi:hypothetical protein
LKSGIELIADERQRQMDKEGWTPAHDDEHDDDSLAFAAVCYTLPREFSSTRVKVEQEDISGGRGDCPVWGAVKYRVPKLWPEGWHGVWGKQKDRVRALVRAGALIAGEIDRLQRADSGRVI